MTTHFNQGEHKQRRREARAAMPPAEPLLWSKLKGRQLLGCKFRRQFGVGPYQLDFYSAELKLAVELDGESTMSPRRDVTIADAMRMSPPSASAFFGF